jgi:hypothetical protein
MAHEPRTFLMHVVRPFKLRAAQSFRRFTWKLAYDEPYRSPARTGVIGSRASAQ